MLYIYNYMKLFIDEKMYKEKCFSFDYIAYWL